MTLQQGLPQEYSTEMLRKNGDTVLLLFHKWVANWAQFSPKLLAFQQTKIQWLQLQSQWVFSLFWLVFFNRDKKISTHAQVFSPKETKFLTSFFIIWIQHNYWWISWAISLLIFLKFLEILSACFQLFSLWTFIILAKIQENF